MTAEASPVERALAERPFDDLLAEAVAAHGHLCPGLVLGTRMVIAGTRETGVAAPRTAGKALVVIVEIDRCATDAIQALAGVSLGKRTLKFLDYGKTAATFVNVPAGLAVRIAAREGARRLALDWAPGATDARAAQIAAYRVMPEPDLLAIAPVTVAPGLLDRHRVRVSCDLCGEDVHYEREVTVAGRTLCRPCAGPGYCSPAR